MGEQESGDKTEEPTPHKLREARKKGQVAKSKDITQALVLFFAFMTLKGTVKKIWQYMNEISVFSFQRIPEELTSALIGIIFDQVIYVLMFSVGPLFIVVFFGAIIIEALQTGFLISFEPLKMDINKLNPIEGFKKFFKLKQIVEVIKSIAKLMIVVAIMYFVWVKELNLIIFAQQLHHWELMVRAATIVFTVVVRVTIFYLFIALLDYFYQRFEYMKGLKMSKKEVKDEYKRLEGDPMIKQRQRDAARALAQGRQMSSVPGADVVVTNPTHYAVAIQYKANEMISPLIIAKGQNLVAKNIVALAETHYVPIIENPPLARTLYKKIEVGQMIPGEYYKAVAEILAFVYNLKKKRSQKK